MPHLDFITSVDPVKRVVYNKHYIKKVFCKIDFKNPVEFDRIKEIVKSFDDFKDWEAINHVTFEDGVHQQTITNQSIGYRQYKKNENVEKTIIRDSILLAFNKYIDFEALKAAAADLLKHEDFKNNIRTIGIKKISDINLKFEDIQDHFKNVAHTPKMEHTNINDYTCVVENNKGTCVIKFIILKQEDSLYRCVLDIDIIRNKDTEEFEQTLQLVNDEHFSIFRWCVQDQFIALMEER